MNRIGSLGRGGFLSVRHLLACLACMLPFTLATGADPLSPPAAVLRIPVPPYARVQAGVSVDPFDASLNVLLFGQLTGATNAEAADSLSLWDHDTQALIAAFRASGGAAGLVDGAWYANLANAIPASIQLPWGTGFEISSRHDATQEVWLTSSNSWATNNAVLLSGPGAYLIPNLPGSNYYLKAWLDTTSNGVLDATEAFGVFTNNPVIVTNQVTGKDIVLVDADTDGDGLPDWWEVQRFGSITNWASSSDPDNDGYSNLDEFNAGTNPLNGNSHPWNISGTIAYSGPQTGTVYVIACASSGSWMAVGGTMLSTTGAYTITHLPSNTNYWITAYRNSAGCETNLFWEARGSFTSNPVCLSTNIANIDIALVDPDTDGDGMPDWWELAHGLCPTNNVDASWDADLDGLTNLQEYQHGTDPNSRDTDSDGLADAQEISGELGYSMQVDSNTAAWVEFSGVAQWITNWPAEAGSAMVSRAFSAPLSAPVVVDGYAGTAIRISPSGFFLVDAPDTDTNNVPDGWDKACSTNSPRILPEDPVAWWRLDGAQNGWTTDCSGNQYDAVVLGAIPCTNSGIQAGCFEFNGASSAIVVPGLALRNRFPANGSISLAAWVKVRNYHSDYTTIVAMDSGIDIQTRASIRMDANGVPYYFCRMSSGGAGTGGGMLFSDRGALSSNEWHQLIAMQTGIVAQLYVDGVLAGSSTNFPPLIMLPWEYDIRPPYSTYAGIGVAASIGAWTDWWGAPESTFDGWIDDVRLYDRALKSEEITRSFFFKHVLPDTALTNVVAPFWREMASSATGGVWSSVFGTGTNARVVVTWENMRTISCCPTQALAVQVEYTASNRAFAFRYRAIPGASFPINATYAIGIQGPTTNACAVFAPTNCVNAGTTIRFVPVILDPCHADTDGDGMPDKWELDHGFNPLDPSDAAADSDGDGYSNLEESQAGTGAFDPYSHPWNISGTVSYSGLQTGMILVAASTNLSTWTGSYATNIAAPGAFTLTHLPTNRTYWVVAWRDSNGNRSNDYWEAQTNYVGNPVLLDHETDGLALQLVDSDADSDGDGLPDYWEILYGLNPISSSHSEADQDADRDGYSNLEEFQAGTDPQDANSHPWNISGTISYSGPQTGPIRVVAYSSDWSAAYATNLATFGDFTLTHVPANDWYWVEAWMESYDDGINDYLNPRAFCDGNPIYLGSEISSLTLRLTDPDTDGDGIPDWWNVANGYGPYGGTVWMTDGDDDGFPNWYEYIYNTDPNSGDSHPHVSVFVDPATTIFRVNQTGTTNAPFATIAQALDVARTNQYSIIQLAAGVYQGPENCGLIALKNNSR